MISDEKTKHDLYEKIALAVILVLSLLAARLIVGLKSSILLSSPIGLKQSGLSVSMPSGNGWQCDPNWIYEDNSFVLNSVFSTQGFSQSYTQCHYLLADRPMPEQLRKKPEQLPKKDELALDELALSVKDRFDEQAAQFNGEINQTGHFSSNLLKIEWAKIIRYTTSETPEAGKEQRIEAYEIIFGICSLPGGRQLEIEVLAPYEEKEMVFSAFERIVKNIQFSDNGLLAAGAEIVGETKRDGINDYLAARTNENGVVNFFMMQNQDGNTIGFTMDVIGVKTQASRAFKAVNFYAIQSPFPYDEIGIYNGDDSFEQFNWKVRSNSPRGRKTIEMEFKGGLLTMRPVNANRPAEKEYALGDAAFPDVILEPVLQKLLVSPHKEIIIDVVRADGTMTPVYIRNVPPSGNKTSSFVLRIEVLDGRGFWQQIYYNDKKEPMKIMMGQESVYTLQRATADQIAQAFPRFADVVKNPFGLLEKDIQR